MRSIVSIVRLMPLFPLAMFPLASAQAGLFDFLEPAPPPQPVIIERPAPVELAPLTQPLRKPAVHRHISVVRKIKNDKALTLDHKSAALQKDATLRDGDAVMTQQGIRVFAGASKGEHQTDEFATLAETKGLSPAEQAALAEIDAHRSEEGSKTADADALATGRSVVANTSLAWKWLRDPKGRLVRYVGP